LKDDSKAMPRSLQLQEKRSALLNTLVELAAIERGVDVSTPLPPRLRTSIWEQVMSAYRAWFDLLASGAYVEATSRLEKVLVELCYLDRAICHAIEKERMEAPMPRST
jgi:hypothetical protein